MSGAISADLAAAIRSSLDLRQTQQRGRLSAIGANYVPALRQAGQGELADRLLAVTTDLVGDAERPGNLALLRSEIEGLLLGATIIDPPGPSPVGSGSGSGSGEGEVEPPPPPPAAPAGYTRRANPGGWLLTSNVQPWSYYEGFDAGMFIDDGQGLYLRHADLGPSLNQYLAWRGVSRPARHLTIEDSVVHGMTVGVSATVTNPWDVHTEGLWISNAEDVTIRRTDFHNNAHFHIAWRHWPANYIRRAVVEECRFANGWRGLSDPNNSWYNCQSGPGHEITYRGCVFTQALDCNGVAALANGRYGNVLVEDSVWVEDDTAGIPGIADQVTYRLALAG